MNRRLKDIILVVLVFFFVLVVNMIAYFLWLQMDLTEDKKYSISESTKELIEEVEHPIFIRVLLEGDFPAGFKRLQTAIKDKLDELHTLNPNIDYDFYNPNTGEQGVVNQRKEEWAKVGVRPTNFHMLSGDERVEKLIYPYAIITIGTEKLYVNLLEEQLPGMSPELVINNSINLIEYKISQAIENGLRKQKPAIVFTQGQGELSNERLGSIYNTLSKFYRIGRINLDSTYFIPSEVSVVIVPKPTKPFSEEKKFMIDQYVMRGGKVLWLIDQFEVELDSISGEDFYFPKPYRLNLDDIFFKYGFRINSDLVMDVESTRIPIVIGEAGGKPQIDLFRWYYHLLISPDPSHIITKSLNPINLVNASTIDTLKTKKPVEKTIILSSSRNSKFVMNPIRISYNLLRIPQNEMNFNQSHLPVGVLLKGTFTSLYENRVSGNMNAMLKSLDQEFIAESPLTRMMVVSDGDIIANEFDYKNEQYSEVGYNKYEKTVFANKEFILNAVEFLINPNGVLQARNKSIKVRMLNSSKAQNEKTKWQLINIGVPILLLALYGFIFNYLRRKKYTKGI